MAQLALTIFRMTRNMMSMLMFVMMLMTAAAFIVIIMLVSTAAFVIIIMMMFVMVIAAAAVNAVFMRMIMLVDMSTAVTVTMAWNVLHACMIMILTAVPAGTAFRMYAVIFRAFDMSVNMTESTHCVGTVAHIFQIVNNFLHKIYRLSYKLAYSALSLIVV